MSERHRQIGTYSQTAFVRMIKFLSKDGIINKMNHTCNMKLNIFSSFLFVYSFIYLFIYLFTMFVRFAISLQLLGCAIIQKMWVTKPVSILVMYVRDLPELKMPQK